MLPVLRVGVQGPFYQDNSNKMRQLQGKIILERNLIHICVLKYIFLSWNISSISLYIISWKMRNLNKRNILTKNESINRTLKKCWENNFKNMGTTCTQFCKSRKFFSIQILFRKKLRADWSWGMLAIIRRRIFYLPVCYPKS